MGEGKTGGSCALGGFLFVRQLGGGVGGFVRVYINYRVDAYDFGRLEWDGRIHVLVQRENSIWAHGLVYFRWSSQALSRTR